MSHVSDVIICLSPGEEIDDNATTPPIQEINKYLMAQNRGELKKVDDYAGGYKAVQAAVWMGAFNHLDIPEFLNVVKAQQWEGREIVQVFIKDEHEKTFTPRSI